MLIVLCSSCKESTEDEKAMQQMVERLFPEYASQFSFEQSEKIDKDWYEIEAKEEQYEYGEITQIRWL